MTITLDLTQDIEDRLREEAAKKGQDPAGFVRALVEKQLREGEVGAAEDDEAEDPGALARAVAKMTSRTPEERAEARARAIAELKPRIPPPPGSNGMEFVRGKWPGEETDEEIRAALEAVE